MDRAGGVGAAVDPGSSTARLGQGGSLGRGGGKIALSLLAGERAEPDSQCRNSAACHHNGTCPPGQRGSSRGGSGHQSRDFPNHGTRTPGKRQPHGGVGDSCVGDVAGWRGGHADLLRGLRYSPASSVGGELAARGGSLHLRQLAHAHSGGSSATSYLHSVGDGSCLLSSPVFTELPEQLLSVFLWAL